ncbi:Apoptosis-inducing factor 2 [Globomyces sp. JEL0801]|nr:Apoptosis-inducing factor 2 [Globomyces sp. JEL0801]
MSKDLNIVVIGGGLAGATTIKKLIKKFRSNSSCSITLIEIQEEIYLNLGSPRSLVDESFTEKCYFKTNSIFKGFPRGKLVIGNVESMDSKTVTVFINGTSSIVPYDYLVIATGRKFFGPYKYYTQTKADSVEHLKRYSQAIKTANSVLLVGGGASSIETACEIKELYPEKKVTIISNGLLTGTVIKPAIIVKLKSKIQSLGISLLLKKRLVKETGMVDFLTTQTWKTTTSEEIQADVTLDSTIPPIPNSSFLESFDKNAVNESKYIKVRLTLQIPNHNNIFSLGDVANTGAPKMVVCIDGQASLVATNIYNHYHEKQLKSYQIPAYDTIFIGFGKQKAFGVISGMNNFLIDIVAKQGKCKDLYVGTAGAVYNTK